MKKTFFDYKLFLNGLSQLKLIGWIFFVISVIVSVLPPIMSWLDEKTAGHKTAVPDILSVTPFLIVVMFFTSIIMVYSLFSFLNKRNGSDFYHSVPNTRTSILMSFAASILTWLYIIIITSVLLAALVYFITGAPFNYSTIPYLIFTFMAGSTLMVSVALSAMSITGTFLSNVVVTGLILFLPRFITVVFSNIIKDKLLIISTNDYGMFTNVNYNIPVKFFLSIVPFTRMIVNTENLFVFTNGILFTFAAGIFYLGIALLLFNLRKSEAAQQSAPNPVLQHIYRCALTFPVAIIIPCSYFAAQNKENWFFYNMSLILAVSIVCLLIYFIYELISTRKLKNLVKAAPVFSVVIISAIVFGMALFAGESSALAFTPSKDEIKSVSFINRNYNNWNSYNKLMIEKINYSNSELLDIVSTELSDTVKLIKNSRNDYNSKRGYLSEQAFRINLKNGKSAERRILLDGNQSVKIDEIKFTNQEYIKALTAFPPENSIKSLGVGNIADEDDKKKIWDSFKDECKKLSAEDFTKVLLNDIPVKPYNDSGYFTVNNIYISGSIGLENYQNNYNITSLTPKTAQLYIDMASNENRGKALEILNKIDITQKIPYNYNINLINSRDENGNTKNINNDRYYIESENRMQSRFPLEMDTEIFRIMLENAQNPVKISSTIANVNLYIDNQSYNFYISLDNKSRLEFDKLYSKYILGK